ncbi:MAG: hypothetical protein Q9163_001900 [Psora crenata]
MEGIQKETQGRLDKIEEGMLKLHRTRAQRLVDLLEKRSAIQNDMLATSTKLEDAFFRAHASLQSALERRIRELKESQ